jgi:predicted signal transduction protein with EAL and GGDEF domain
MRIRRTDGSLIAANDVVPVAERLGLVRLARPPRARTRRRRNDRVAGVAGEPQCLARLDHRSRLVGGAGLAAAQPSGVAERLIVEITESAAIHDIDETRGFVARVKDLGCRIAIDDFGAGYTSFRNLRKLGVDIVKIDGAFVQHIMRSEDDRAFVRTLIDLAKRLKLATVAEWVQDEKPRACWRRGAATICRARYVGLASTERPWLASLAKAI